MTRDKVERLIKEFKASADPGGYASAHFEELWKAHWKLLNSDEAADPKTGELICASCAEKNDIIAGMEKDLAAWRIRYMNKEREVNDELALEAEEFFAEGKRVFDYWKEKCKHRGVFDRARYKLVKPFLKRHPIELVYRAIDGAAYDCFTTKRKNGTTKKHDGFDLIFRDAQHFEDFCNKAPLPPKK